ncbi:hypothetical protein QEH34_gp29 [Microbacterium phage Footloose]|uniref:Uncharacterized protein n=1 Tax=Microbacterium phage Footloose TaxID=2836048 RepID=A0A8F3E9G4_9CAUD|nr:hypothetical protein QEH34_gp29 [Microbacterium phage Footloose]QWY84611.1 hypothetical protein SEA_FOOTLOOSE_29 [Microbacterium phage Footloose]
MQSRGLSPATKLSVELDAICSRNRYTTDPAPVLDELRATAGERTDVLAEAVGTWVGYFEGEYTATLCTALRTLPGLEPWIALGQHRRSLPDPSTPELLGHGQAAALPLYITTNPDILDAP